MKGVGIMGLKSRNILGLRAMCRQDMELILTEAKRWKESGLKAEGKPLAGKSIINFFIEPSTRTRISFELAGKRLGAEVVNFSANSSSLLKGEGLEETAETLQAMAVDLLVVRHAAAGVPARLAEILNLHVINAGDGAHEHPTQALLDIFTIKEKLGTVQGRKIVIVGDIIHSRVARSNIWGLQKLGAQVAVVGPATLLPPGLEALGVEVSTRLEAVLPGADVVNVLRLQQERQRSGLLPSLADYSFQYRITKERLALTGKDTLVLHPGPMNLEVEITKEVAASSQSVINEQVTNGVAVRMALLNLILGGKN
jgi:aspartate carbamoyltransferase catalytic subunit